MTATRTPPPTPNQWFLPIAISLLSYSLASHCHFLNFSSFHMFLLLPLPSSPQRYVEDCDMKEHKLILWGLNMLRIGPELLNAQGKRIICAHIRYNKKMY